MVKEKRRRKWKRLLTRSLVILLGIFVLLIIIASPLTKYLIQKYDVDFTGREITLGRTFVNPFAASAGLYNFQMFEADADSVFFSADKFKANLSLFRMISGVYDVSSIRLNNPEVRIVRDDTIFNFSDIIEKLLATEDTLEKEVLKLNIRNITVSNGTVHFSEKKIPVDLTITEINFRSPGIYWDVDSINGSFSLVPGEGKFSGDFMFNQENMDYRIALDLSDFDIKLFEPYIDEMTGNANISAIADMSLNSSGNLNRLMKGQASGSFELNDFHFGPDSESDYLSLERLLVQFREIDLELNRFYFDSILFDKPNILYQSYDTLDNFRRLFRTYLAEEAEEEVKEAADTVNMLVNLIGADYYIHSFAVNEGRIEFNDYSITEKFNIAIDPLNIISDTIDKQNRRVKVEMDGRIKPYGRFAANLSMNPENEENFDFEYEFRDISAPMFNPYISSFTSYQLDRGTIEMHGTWSVKNAAINALNHFLVIDPQDTKKVRGKDKWVPLPLIMSFVRERGSVIDYQIPVKGDLKDPNFKIHDVISDILRNILVKPPTTPYRLQVRNVKNKIEKALTVKWKMRQYEIENDQEKFMKKIADFLEDNPEASIVVQPIFHVEKEKENLLLFEAKKKYFFLEQNKEVTALSRRDSMEVEKLSTKDPAFINFMDRSLKNSELLTLQEKCARFVGMESIEQKYGVLVEKRRDAFMEFFRENETSERIEMLEIKNQVPFNWFSYYDINYKGDIPDELSEAFNALYELNSEPPRREFFDPPRR